MSLTENFGTDVSPYQPIKIVADQMEREMDDRLIAFFGSEEAAKEMAHLFVLETKVHETTTEVDETGRYIRFKSEVEYRIRAKTAEELAGDDK